MIVLSLNHAAIVMIIASIAGAVYNYTKRDLEDDDVLLTVSLGAVGGAFVGVFIMALFRVIAA